MSLSTSKKWQAIALLLDGDTMKVTAKKIDAKLHDVENMVYKCMPQGLIKFRIENKFTAV